MKLCLKNKMNARLVYLAGSIYRMDDECLEWRAEVSKQLRAKKIMTLSPMSRDYRGMEQSDDIRRRIVEGDKRDITASDTLLAFCPKPSFGTAMEIHFAWSLHKQIIIVSQHGSPWLKYHATAIFPTIDEAVSSLVFV